MYSLYSFNSLNCLHKRPTGWIPVGCSRTPRESLISLFNVNWPPYMTIQPSGWEMPLPSRRSLHPSRPWLELCRPLKARTATNSIVLSTFTSSAGYPKPTLTTVWIIGSRMTSGWCLQVLHPAALCCLAADTGSSGAGLQ